ncbi:hypothetical protein OBA18_00845 [Pelagibacteraceae bacterium]|nr:hypothetical protein [Pelagibacteraceae bacterium]
MILRKSLILFLFIFFIGCSTVTSTLEGVVHGAQKDVSDIYHYSTCIFTDAQCFE